LIKKRDINLVHAAGMKGILLGRIACRICKCKFIMHLHDTSVPGPLFSYFHRAMTGSTDRCLVISNAVGEFAHDVFGVSQEQIALLYNGIDLEKAANPIPEKRKSLRREFNLPDNVPVVGIVGRLSTIKGQTLFLQAMPDLLRTHPNVHLLFAGDGPARAECETLVAKLNLKNSVVFAGYRTDMPDVLSAIDLLAVPSLYHTAPLRPWPRAARWLLLTSGGCPS